MIGADGDGESAHGTRSSVLKDLECGESGPMRKLSSTVTRSRKDRGVVEGVGSAIASVCVSK